MKKVLVIGIQLKLKKNDKSKVGNNKNLAIAEKYVFHLCNFV